MSFAIFPPVSPWENYQVYDDRKYKKKRMHNPTVLVDSVLLNQTIECTREKWKWLTDGSRAWLAVMIRCGQVFMM